MRGSRLLGIMLCSTVPDAPLNSLLCIENSMMTYSSMTGSMRVHGLLNVGVPVLPILRLSAPGVPLNSTIVVVVIVESIILDVF